MADIKSPKVLYAKAGLFVLTGAIASFLILLDNPSTKVALLLGLAIWSFARAYYFAFYVIQHYADPSYRYAGLWDFAKYALFNPRPAPPLPPAPRRSEAAGSPPLVPSPHSAATPSSKPSPGIAIPGSSPPSRHSERSEESLPPVPPSDTPAAPPSNGLASSRNSLPPPLSPSPGTPGEGRGEGSAPQRTDN